MTYVSLVNYFKDSYIKANGLSFKAVMGGQVVISGSSSKL